MTQEEFIKRTIYHVEHRKEIGEGNLEAFVKKDLEHYLADVLEEIEQSEELRNPAFVSVRVYLQKLAGQRKRAGLPK